jgi:hypothetical protein
MGDAGGWWRSKKPAGPFNPLALLSRKYAKGAFFAIETGMAGDEGGLFIAFRLSSTTGMINAV